MRSSCLIAVVLLAGVSVFASSEYLQDFSQRFQFQGAKDLPANWPRLPFSSVQQTLTINSTTFDALWLVTDIGVLDWNVDSDVVTHVSLDSKPMLATAADFRLQDLSGPYSNLTLAAVTSSSFAWIRCSSATSCDTIAQHEYSFGSAVTSTAHTQLMGSQQLFVGSESGVFHADLGSEAAAVTHVTLNISDVTALSWSASQSTLAVGTRLKLWTMVEHRGWRFEWNFGVMDGPNISALAWPPTNTAHDSTGGNGGDLWIGTPQDVDIRHADLTFERIVGRQDQALHWGTKYGLPVGNITFLSSSVRDKTVWGGSASGAFRFAVDTDEWRYYAGNRWLPDNHVVSIAELNGVTLISTKTGVAKLTFQPYSLKSKAEAFQQIKAERHNYYGLVQDVGLSQYGDLSTWFGRPSANSGLWTSLYLVAASMRFAVTKDSQDKAAAVQAFQGMKLLIDVTGVAGYPARSVAPLNESHGGAARHWFASTTKAGAGLQWNGDTSSDEITGHLFAYPIYMDLVCQTPAEKAEAQAVYLSIIDHIMANNWKLLGHDGQPTHWGFWDPASVNDLQRDFDERGTNSLQIITWLATAFSLTGDTKYSAAMNKLGIEAGYYDNLINCRMSIPSDINYSDDELIYLPFFQLWWNTKHARQVQMPQQLEAAINLSMKRVWRMVSPYQSSLFIFINSASNPASTTTSRRTAEMDAALQNLVRWPMEWIDWPYDNSKRIDLTWLSSDQDEVGSVCCSLQVTEPDTRSNLRWNADVFRLTGGSGVTETDPSAWLLPYWLGRYMGYL